jgi:hypothetical protein
MLIVTSSATSASHRRDRWRSRRRDEIAGSVDGVAEPSSRPFWIALAGVGLVIVIAIGFEIFNLVDHATHHEPTFSVHANVASVRAIGDDKVVISASLTSLESKTSQVTCLVGIDAPGEPLAYPTQVTEQLGPGQTKDIEITRSLLKPAARAVVLSDVAFTCT